MKSLSILLALTFSVMFSSTSFADWKKVETNVDKNTFYVDYEGIRRHDGFVYFWWLVDLPEPTGQGYWSDKIYTQGDCDSFRFKYLSGSGHKEPMGGGTGDTYTNENPEWHYPPPNSPIETILKSVCEYVN